MCGTHKPLCKRQRPSSTYMGKLPKHKIREEGTKSLISEGNENMAAVNPRLLIITVNTEH